MSVSGKDWTAKGTTKRAKDCQHFCKEDGNCQGFDWNSKDLSCRVWFSDLLEESNYLDDEADFECGIVHHRPNEDAPIAEKNKFREKEQKNYSWLKRTHIELQ